MVASFKELTAFFKEVGAADVGHTNKSYLAHCIGVQNDMKKWGGTRRCAGRRFFIRCTAPSFSRILPCL